MVVFCEILHMFPFASVRQMNKFISPLVASFVTELVYSVLKLSSLHHIYMNTYHFVEFGIDLVLFYVFWYSPSVFGWYQFGISFQKFLKLISHMYIL